jgi:hypothetical protein
LFNSSEEKRKEILSDLRNNYKDYIVKPQREGGGNNYYNEEILKLLPEGDEQPSNMLMNAVIMERVNPPEQKCHVLHENSLKEMTCVTEYSIFGVLLSDEKEINTNRGIGYFLRTKESSVQEGGLVSGFSAANLPYLI